MVSIDTIRDKMECGAALTEEEGKALLEYLDGNPIRLISSPCKETLVPSEGDWCLVMKKGADRPRIACFNGLGSKKGWGGMDWSGDSGHSTDSWMVDEVLWWVPLDRINITRRFQKVLTIELAGE